MKTKKILGVLLAVSLLAVAVLPVMASAASTDVISVLTNANTGNVQNNNGEDDTYCKIDFSDDAVMTLTVGANATDKGAQAYMVDDFFSTEFVSLNETPYLYYDVEGTGSWDFWIRIDNTDKGLIKLSNLLDVEKIEAGSGSINLAEALPKEDTISFSGDKLDPSVFKWVAYGSEGDTVTFKKLYFAGENKSDVSIDAGASAAAPSETSSSTSVTSNSSKKANTTSSKKPVETGEATIPVIAVAALAVVSASAIVVSKKRR